MIGVSQIAKLSHQAAVLSSKIDRLIAGPPVLMKQVLHSPGLKKRDVADLLNPASSHGTFAKAGQKPLFGRDTLFQKVLAKGYPEYDPSQARDQEGQWTSGGGSAGADTPAAAAQGGGWQRAAQLAGTAAFGLASVGGAAVAVRTGNAAAAYNLARRGNEMLQAAARVKGGSKVSRSLLESSAYNLSGAQTRLSLMPYQWELSRRFKGMTTSVYFGRDKGSGASGIIISVRSKAATVDAVQSGRVPSNVFIGEMLLHNSDSLGKALLVGNLYAPATSAGALFSRNYMNTVMRTAVANKVDNIHTFAGSSMGGFLWPQRGFELASPMGDVAQALRRTIATRAGQLLDGGAITKSQYDEIAAVAAKWGKTAPTQIAHMDTKVAVGGLKLKDFPDVDVVRGDMTLGKALLAGTNGFYVLPRAKYETLLTITKSVGKGYPEYDDDQPRDEGGKWTAGGGGSSSPPKPASQAADIKVKPLADFVGPKPADFKGADAGNKWRLAAAAALGFGAVAAGVGTYVIVRRGLAPAKLVVEPVTTTSGKPLLLGVESGAADVAALVKSTLDRLPAAHLEALKANGVAIYAVKNMGAVEQALLRAPVANSTYRGFYHPGLRAIVVPAGIMVNGQQYALPPALLQRVIVHEVAHALDSKGAGIGYLSRSMVKAIADDYSAYLQKHPENGLLLHAWFTRNYKTADNIRNEIFAEVYAAKYLNRGNWREAHHMFFGETLNEHAVAKHFPKTMALVGNMDVGKPRGLADRLRYGFESAAIQRSADDQWTRLQGYLTSAT